MTKRKTFTEKIDDLLNLASDDEIESDEPNCQITGIRALVDWRWSIQKQRIRLGNQLFAKTALSEEDQEETEEGDRKPQPRVVDPETVEILTKYYEVFRTMELELDKDIKRSVENEEIFQYMKPIKGLGPLLSAKLISMIDIKRPNTVSALWRYAGLGVVKDENGVGHAERRVKGEPLHYNMKLKSTMFLVVSSFLKSNSPYRVVYDRTKERYKQIRPDWPLMRIHRTAMRKTAQVFLSHLYEVWRKLEGLSVRPLYVHEYLKDAGHEFVYQAKDFGWDVPGAREEAA